MIVVIVIVIAIVIVTIIVMVIPLYKPRIPSVLIILLTICLPVNCTSEVFCICNRIFTSSYGTVTDSCRTPAAEPMIVTVIEVIIITAIEFIIIIEIPATISLYPFSLRLSLTASLIAFSGAMPVLLIIMIILVMIVAVVLIMMMIIETVMMIMMRWIQLC